MTSAPRGPKLRCGPKLTHAPRARATDFFGDQPALSQGIGYAVVVGFGAPARARLRPRSPRPGHSGVRGRQGER